MSLFKTSDERFIKQLEKAEAKMLLRLYGLKKTDTNCPVYPYLLKPEKLQLSSYEKLPQNIIRLNVAYNTKWSGYVSDTTRMHYNQIVLGTMYCEDVESCKETSYNSIGTIKIPFLSKSKIVNLPIRGTHNVEIKCTKLVVELIEVFVEHNGKLITDEEFKDHLRKTL